MISRENRAAPDIEGKFTFAPRPVGPSPSARDREMHGASDSPAASATVSTRGPASSGGVRRGSARATETVRSDGAVGENFGPRLCKLIDFGTAVGLREVSDGGFRISQAAGLVGQLVTLVTVPCCASCSSASYHTRAVTTQ